MNLLVIDDDDNVRSSLIKYLGLYGYIAEGADHPLKAQAMLNNKSYDALLLDLRMPDMDGLEFLAWLNSEGFLVPVIMISAHGELGDAVQAMKLGARDYLAKPFDSEELLLRVQRLNDEIMLSKQVKSQEAVNQRNHGYQPSVCFWGDSPAMIRLQSEMERAAATDASILLLGESGTGKEVAARWIHEHSNRADQPFIPVNLGSLSLVESELFGYEKGAFTGADKRHPGIFESAQGGTVFLDEIGELPLEVQPKLLRVLQEGMVKRMGNPREFPVNVRVIAATNRELELMVKEGSFRQDLFFRLNIIPFTLSPLRQRRQDIPGLIEILLERISSRIGKKNLGVDSQTMDFLMQYDFPGNIRELENLLERWAILSPDNVIRGETGIPADKHQDYNLKAHEQKLIGAALAAHGNNRTHTAEALGITRKTLISKIQEYGL
ncbi:sigma-54-dependent transcriptional regulator [Spirochaeta dissipatitropha]